MNILEKIIEFKRKEVAERKVAKPVAELEKEAGFSRAVYSLRQSLVDPAKTGIIAEFKRRSPSKGVINDKVTVESVTKGYTAAGASCLSVLTDEEFFGGTGLRQLDEVLEVVDLLAHWYGPALVVQLVAEQFRKFLHALLGGGDILVHLEIDRV